MRSMRLFVGLVGILPLVVFAGTVWLTDGAPFEPLGMRAAAGKHDGAAVPVAADPPLRPVAPEASMIAAVPLATGDADLDRLNRLARAGDREALLLLTIIEGGRGRAGDPWR